MLLDRSYGREWYETSVLKHEKKRSFRIRRMEDNYNNNKKKASASDGRRKRRFLFTSE